MPSYWVYGLRLESCLPFPELIADAGRNGTPADVTVLLGDIELPGDVTADANGYYVTPEAITFQVAEVGVFSVRGGHEILIQPASGAEERRLRHSVLGQAMGALLCQKGLFVLHASAVAIGASLVAFIGLSGAGKSTTAGALHERGHAVLTDDLLVLSLPDPALPDPALPDPALPDPALALPLALPSYPALRLMPAALTALGKAADSPPFLHPGGYKHACRLANGFAQTPTRLSHIYALSVGDTLAIERLGPQAALLELISHSYNGVLLQATGTLKLHFKQCAQIVSSVEICRLQRPLDLNSVAALAELVERSVAQDTPVPGLAA